MEIEAEERRRGEEGMEGVRVNTREIAKEYPHTSCPKHYWWSLTNLYLLDVRDDQALQCVHGNADVVISLVGNGRAVGIDMAIENGELAQGQ